LDRRGFELVNPSDSGHGGVVDSELRRFVAAATHDLHGLQAALQMGVDLLRSQADDAGREPLLSLIERQASRLGRLTDDLFLLSVADTGRLEVRPDSVELEPLLRDAAAESGETGVEVHSTEGLRVWADPTHVQRIVANLVRNAVRHGAPPVGISAAGQDDQVEIRVSDDGPGVPREFVPRLFRRFARAGGTHLGAGLGLSIVAELAHLNGGSAHFDPHPPGQPGATFVVRLPRYPLAGAAGDAGHRTPARSDLAPAGAHHDRFATVMARNRELANCLANLLDDALALRVRSEELRENLRTSMRGRRRLLSESRALADSQKLEPFLDLTGEPSGAGTDAAALSLAELRQARAVTDDRVAAALEVHRWTVSAIEGRDDQLLSTVRAYVEALGGHLEIVAVFDDQRLPLRPPPYPPVEPADLITTGRPDPPT
jgi:two-component sensor histidine kinase/DNA-binding XRE family transcriptional regulator